MNISDFTKGKIKTDHLYIAAAILIPALVVALLIFTAGASARRIGIESNSAIGNVNRRTDSNASQSNFIEFGGQTSAVCSNPVRVSPPATNFANQVNSAGNGTCFYLRNGTYNFEEVKPKNNMIFEGESVEGVIVDGSGKKHAFMGENDNITIRNMQFRNFNWVNSGNRVWEQLAPILGKRAVWDQSNRGSGWVIDNIWSHNNVASGLHVGDGFTVRNSKFYDNGVTGISGDRFRGGGLVENNEVYGNGNNQAGGQFINGAGMKFVWADDDNNQFVIRNNFVHDNEAIGVWCDLDCNNVLIEGNNIRDNASSNGKGRRGIFYELSRNATIRNNTITNSSENGFAAAGCISVASSQDVVIENNTVRDCYGALTVKAEKRPYPEESYLEDPVIWNQIVAKFTARVTFRNNTIINSRGVGIHRSSGNQDATQYGSVFFEGNDYDGSNPNNMNFWWGLDVLNYNQWRSAGRQ